MFGEHHPCKQTLGYPTSIRARALTDNFLLTGPGLFFSCFRVPSTQADSSVNAPDLELPPEQAAQRITEKQEAWTQKTLTKRGAAGWRPRKMHRLAARKVVRMMDSQLRTTTGKGLKRFRYSSQSKKWRDWRRCFH